MRLSSLSLLCNLLTHYTHHRAAVFINGADSKIRPLSGVSYPTYHVQNSQSTDSACLVIYHMIIAAPAALLSGLSPPTETHPAGVALCPVPGNAA